MTESKDINILFVTNYRQLYGANNSLLQLMLELREKGVSPVVLMPCESAISNNDLGLELQMHGIPYIESPMRLDKHPDWKKVIANYILAMLYRRKAYRAVRHLKVDIVHTNSSTMSVGAYISKKIGKPHVWHLREFGDLDYRFKTPFGKPFQRIIYGGHNTFIAISRKVKDHYAKYVGNQKIQLIYNGIKPSPKRIGGSGDIVQLCIVGLLHPNKGQMEVLETTAELVNNRNIKNFHVTIVGDGDQNYLGKMIKFTRDQGIYDYVTFTGRRNDVPDLLTRMDIGIMASSHEAFGRTTVEFMMAGLPVVASDSGANQEIVEDGVTGLIYSNGDRTSMADKIEMLIKDRELREKLGSNGLRLAEKKFSSKANSDAVYKLYNEILSRR